jgi:hypothetical protein
MITPISSPSRRWRLFQMAEPKKRYFRITISMWIHPSARKHGVDGEDIGHALDNAMSIDDQDDDTRLYLGQLATPSYLRWSRSSATMDRSW